MRQVQVVDGVAEEDEENSFEAREEVEEEVVEAILEEVASSKEPLESTTRTKNPSLAKKKL